MIDCSRRYVVGTCLLLVECVWLAGWLANNENYKWLTQPKPNPTMCVDGRGGESDLTFLGQVRLHMHNICLIKENLRMQSLGKPFNLHYWRRPLQPPPPLSHSISPTKQKIY